MSVGKSKVEVCCGPADATADPSSDEDGEEMTESGPLDAQVPFHAAVLETSLQGTTVLQEWNQVIRNSNVLEGVKEEALQAQPSSLPLDFKHEALQQATQSLRRLAQQDVREALKAWESAEAGSQESFRDDRVLSFSSRVVSQCCLPVHSVCRFYHDFITAFVL